MTAESTSSPPAPRSHPARWLLTLVIGLYLFAMSPIAVLFLARTASLSVPGEAPMLTGWLLASFGVRLSAPVHGRLVGVLVPSVFLLFAWAAALAIISQSSPA